MNRTIFLCAAVAAVSVGCAPDYSPVIIENVVPLDATTCALPSGADNLYRPFGRLDVAGGGPYTALALVTSELGTTTNIGSQPATTQESTASNEAILTAVELEYQSNPSLGLQRQTLPYYGVIQPNSKGADNQVLLNLVPPNIGETLRTSLVKGDEITLHVLARMDGHTRSGINFKTNQIDFPIVLTNSGTTCTTFAQTNGCGGVGGQDNVPVTCATP